MSKQSKKRVLFIGSFDTGNSGGGTGGQQFACTSLVSSSLNDRIEWILVDSTGELPMRSIGIRALHAGRRLLTCFYHLAFSRIDTVLIFSAHGFSFLEKGTLCLIASAMGKRTLFAPRSGFILNDLASPVIRRFVQLVLKRASIVICQSPYWADTFKAVEPKSRYEVVHNWIDHKGYTVKTKSDNKRREKPLTILFLGWVAYDKGVIELYEGVRNLSEKYSLQLRLCGKGDAYDELEQRVEQDRMTNQVVLAGWVDADAKKLELNQADIFVLPTHYEGFPNAILEAMASGLPCVCSDIPSITSILTNEEHVCLFKTRDRADLSRALESLIISEEKRNALSIAGRKLIPEQFSIEYGIKNFERLL